MQERALNFAEKEAARQQKRDRERAQGIQDDKAMKRVVEGLGVGLMGLGA